MANRFPSMAFARFKRIEFGFGIWKLGFGEGIIPTADSCPRTDEGMSRGRGNRKISMKHEFHVVYTPIEDGWYMASVPELPGAVTQGQDLDEARLMIQEAVELLLESYQENAMKDAPGDAIWETLAVDVPVT